MDLLGQSFSYSDLRRVWDIETRKGQNVARFIQGKIPIPDSRLSAVRANNAATAVARAYRRKLPKGTPRAVLDSSDAAIQVLTAARESLIEEFLADVVKEINGAAFRLSFTLRYREKKKDVYSLDNPFAANYFASKIVMQNIARAFELRPRSRDLVVEQLATLLNDNFPKTVIRADVHSFYESIPHEKLVDALRSNPALSTSSVRLVRRLLADLDSKKGVATRVGIPRGLGLSAALSESFMQPFDDAIAALPETIF